MTNYDLKICVVGPCEGGKSILTNLIGQQPVSLENYIPTKAIRIQQVSVSIDSQSVAVQLWDYSGDPEYRKYWKILAKGAHGVILVHDRSKLDIPFMEKQIKYFCEKRKLGLERCLLVEMEIDNDQSLAKKLENSDFEGKLKNVRRMHINIASTDLDQATQTVLSELKPFFKRCLENKTTLLN